MPDTDDSIMLSKEFAYWAPHIMEIAHRTNTEDANVGVLDRNDIIQIVSECFLVAWNRVKWDEVNEALDPQAKLWAYLKRNIKLDLGHAIRYVKDGIRIPHREHMSRLSKTGTNINAISSLFPQLKMEEAFANIEEWDSSSYHNELLIDILNQHFSKYLNPKERKIFEMSMGFDRDKMSNKDIAEELMTSETTVKVTKSRALSKLKSNESRRDLAFIVNGAMIPTGADILEFLK